MALLKTREIVAALRQAADHIEQASEMIEDAQLYGHKYGGKPGANVFKFLLEDALSLRGINLDVLRAASPRGAKNETQS